MENDYRTARERVSNENLRRMFGYDDKYKSGEDVCDKTEEPAETQRKCCGNSLAMVYSPYQEWKHLYEIDDGFEKGTIFKELDKPFFGGYRNGGMFNG